MADLGEAEGEQPITYPEVALQVPPELGVVVEVAVVILDLVNLEVLGLLSLSQPKMVLAEHNQLLSPVVEHLQPNLMLL